MRFESEWPGDAIADPICRTYDREDVFFDSLAGRSWNRLDSRSDGTDRWRVETATTDLPGWRASITPIASVVAGLWSRILRGREIRPHQSGLGEGRRPNAEGYRNFPLRDRVCKRPTKLELMGNVVAEPALRRARKFQPAGGRGHKQCFSDACLVS
jgi:hypothetical protein